MRLRAKRDRTEKEIVHALRQFGVIVVTVSSYSAPDLLTYYRGVWLPLEVKSPGGKLTVGQHALWRNTKFPVVETVDEAIACVIRGEKL